MAEATPDTTHSRVGPLSQEEIDRREGGSEKLTSTETMSKVSGKK